VRPDEAEARALIHCGALDSLNATDSRAALMWELACWLRARSAKSASKTRSLFGDAKSNPADQLPPLPADDERERLRREFAVLGFLCDRHPMQLYNNTLNKLHPVKAIDLPRFVGQRVRMAGWLITGKVVTTKHGDPMEFLTFEDESGIVETTFFPQAYGRFCHMIDRNRPYLLTGKVEADWGATTLTVDKVEQIK
jgi:DNA polymerase-3 subunit alpha/error-prone DNA polymerase